MNVHHQQSVVIVGAMNPAIHHPAWYQLMEIITESEFKASMEGQVLVNAVVAQFASDRFSVACVPTRWQVMCDIEDGTHIINIAKATFKKLYHTPVTAYGINHDYHAETSKQIAPALQDFVRETGLPFPSDEKGDAEITYKADGGDCTYTTTISASPRGGNFLYVKNNTNFVVPTSNNTQFDLDPLLEEAFRRNEVRAHLMLSNLLTQFKE